GRPFLRWEPRGLRRPQRPGAGVRPQAKADPVRGTDLGGRCTPCLRATAGRLTKARVRNPWQFRFLRPTRPADPPRDGAGTGRIGRRGWGGSVPVALSRQRDRATTRKDQAGGGSGPFRGFALSRCRDPRAGLGGHRPARELKPEIALSSLFL